MKLPVVRPMNSSVTEYKSSLFKKLCLDSRWIAEPIKNGSRCLVYRENGTIRLFTREWVNLSHKFKEITSRMYRIPNGTLLDSILSKKTRELWVLDILYFGKERITEIAFKERRNILESLVESSRHVKLIEQYVGKEYLFSINVGIIFKNLNSTYRPSKEESENWVRCEKINLGRNV